MAREQMRPASKQDAPDPSYNYERSHPEREAGMGSLENVAGTPTDRPDRQEQAVPNKQAGDRVITGEQDIDQRKSATPAQPDHSMHEEEPLGWDQAPQDIHDPRSKRHPRKEGQGGVK